MKGRLPMSLNLRLWAVVLVAVLPIFTIVVLDYQAQRRELASELEADVLRMLSVSEQQEALALEPVQGGTIALDGEAITTGASFAARRKLQVVWIAISECFSNIWIKKSLRTYWFVRKISERKITRTWLIFLSK